MVIYLPNGATILQPPITWGIPLTQRVKWIVDGITVPVANGIPAGCGPASIWLPGIVEDNSNQSADVSQSGSLPSDYSVLHTSYIVDHTDGRRGRRQHAHLQQPEQLCLGAVDRLL